MTGPGRRRDVDELTHLVEYIRRVLARDTMVGLREWSTHFTASRQSGAYDRCQRLLHAVKSVPLPPHGIGIVRYGEGWLYDRMGLWQESITAYRASLKAFEAVGLPLATEVWMNIGSVYQDQGDWGAAEDAYRKALDVADDPRSRGAVYNNLGGLLLLRDDLDGAAESYAQARALLRSAEDHYNYAAATVGEAGVLRDRGLFGDAQKLLMEALGIYQRLRDPHAVAMTLGALAVTYQYANEVGEAIRWYEIALAIGVAAKDQTVVVRTLANLALTNESAGDHDKALDYLEQAVEGYRELGDRHGEAVALEIGRAHV